MTGSNTQLANGILLMSTFFGSRLVWGPYQTINVFGDIWNAIQYQKTIEGQAWLKSPISPSNIMAIGEAGKASRELMRFQPEPVPLWLAVTYFSANTCLTLLNVYWFGKMVETIRKRFPPPFGTMTEQDEPHEREVVVERGVDKGAKSVDVKQKEVRHRGVKSKLSAVPPPPPQ